MKPIFRSLLLLLLPAMLLAACATPPRQGGLEGTGPAPASRGAEPAPGDNALWRPTPERPPERPRDGVPPLSPAAAQLAGRADADSKAGRHAEAAAQLERALRIAPQHPVLWQNLAVVRYRAGELNKVEGLALKSNALAPRAPDLRRRNWQLIAAVREQLGNPAGAAAAADQARLANPE